MRSLIMMAVTTARVALFAGPVGANDGGGGNETLVPGAAQSLKRSGDCAGLARLKSNLDKAEEKVTNRRGHLERSREALAVTKSVHGRQRVKDRQDVVNQDIEELAAARKDRDALKRQYERLLRSCT